MEGGVGRWNAAVDRALHQHFLDLVAGHAVVGRRAQVQLQFVVTVHADQHGNGDQAAGVTWQAGAGPDVTPRMAGNHFLELAIEVVELFQAAVHMGIAQYRAAYLHAGVVALFLVHGRVLSEPTGKQARGG
ncbi:hypothetical protein G1E_31560 [Pseudomonas sp. TJI-51]|nr:hypothetical protein G1E_31560 [Pseudomonas sp. TJI-51]